MKPARKKSIEPGCAPTATAIKDAAGSPAASPVELGRSSTERGAAPDRAPIPLLGVIEQVLQSIAAGVLLVSREFRPLLANDSFCNMLQVERADVLRYKCHKLFAGPQCHTPSCPLLRVLEGEDRFESEIVLRRGSGDIMPFRVTTTALRGPDEHLLGMVQEYIELPEMKLARQNLEVQAARLETQQRLLNENEITLRQLARGIDTEKERIERRIMDSVGRVVLPLLHNAADVANDAVKPHLQLIRTSLGDLVSPLVDERDAGFSRLSPRELEIAHMIRQGLRSKDIARLFSVAEGTVEQQRKQIRRKLGLKGSRDNLSSYLKMRRQAFLKGPRSSHVHAHRKIVPDIDHIKFIPVILPS